MRLSYLYNGRHYTDKISCTDKTQSLYLNSPPNLNVESPPGVVHLVFHQHRSVCTCFYADAGVFALASLQMQK